jgi:hypothetical protein
VYFHDVVIYKGKQMDDENTTLDKEAQRAYEIYPHQGVFCK